MRPFDHLNTLTVEDYKDDIARYLKNDSRTTHGLITITLRLVEKQFGTDAANKIIEEYDLTKKFGIRRLIDRG